MKSFSLNERRQWLEQSSNTQYDLIVIGGGITGAGIALDALSRGLKTLVIEQNDFSSGTSSKSTKLFHGGLRYLETFQFSLVAESGRERNILAKLAPHLVFPQKMLLPVYKSERYPLFLVSLALWVYDFLARVPRAQKRKILNKKECLELEPNLNSQGLTGAGLYTEYLTSDYRLVIEVLKTAVNMGAHAINYARVHKFTYNQDKKISGVIVHDKIENKEYTITAKKIVSATGPWADDLRMIDEPTEIAKLIHSKGVHITYTNSDFKIKHPIYFTNHDGRHLFVIPRDKTIYIGTTDTPYEMDINNITTSKADIEYITDAFEYAFPHLKIDKTKILSTWAGVRPLINEIGKSTSKISRKDEIFTSSSGLITITGGKLTGYRKMAEKIVDLIEPTSQKTQTHQIALETGRFESHLLEDIKQKLRHLSIDLHWADYLFHHHGIDSLVIIKNIELMNSPVAQREEDLISAQISYCQSFEMAVSVNDYLERRSGFLYFHPEIINKYYDLIKTKFSKVCYE